MTSVRDGAWHDELVRTYEISIYNMIYTRVRNHSTAEDLTQETFTTAWKRRYKVPDDPLKWLYATAKNHLREHRRNGSQRHEDMPGDDSVQVISDAEAGPSPPLDEVMDLRKAIASLTREERQLLWLADVEAELSEDVGKRLGITGANVRQRKKRLSEQIRKILGARYLLQDHGDTRGAPR